MSTEENKIIARRSFEEVWNLGNLDTIDVLYTADQVSHGLGIDVPAGTQGLRQFISIYRTAYPDTHFTIEDQIAEGDKVTTRWTAVGTHRGDLMGIAPTGKRVTVTGITINRIENGKIVETWNNFDALGQLQQLGVIPPPGQTSS
jgi:steroid delta-isomerase-like uncharacterized protein